MSNLDIINLPYPMFPVTEEEKVLLRKAELEFVSYNDEDEWDGLCCVLGNVAFAKELGVMSMLVEKIQESLCYDYDSYGGGYRYYTYLHQLLGATWNLALDSFTPQEMNMFRRVWITKLLNQDVL